VYGTWCVVYGVWRGVFIGGSDGGYEAQRLRDGALLGDWFSGGRWCSKVFVTHEESMAIACR
jgi:hypothetical protein